VSKIKTGILNCQREQSPDVAKDASAVLLDEALCCWMNLSGNLKSPTKRTISFLLLEQF
jgi:hypothetical protein